MVEANDDGQVVPKSIAKHNNIKELALLNKTMKNSY